MEISVTKSHLWAGLILVGLVAFLVVGGMASPRAHGRPILLSPANWQITRYLARAEGWHVALVEEVTNLSALQPGSDLPGDVYGRSKAVDVSVQALVELRRQMERTDAPGPLQGLHALATNSADRALEWARFTAIYLAAPGEAEKSKAQAAGPVANAALAQFGVALEAQRRENVE